MGPARPARTPTTAATDLVAMAAVAAGVAVLAVRVWPDTRSPAELAGVAAALAAGYVMADLLTGFVHWFCDTFFHETTPIIGPGLIAPFREHHREPLLMTRRGVVELTGSSFRAFAPVLWGFLWLGASAPVVFEAFVLALGCGAVATNLLHRWAHDPEPPAIARVLHASGLVLTPTRHARHHAPPYEAGYCVTSGWLNPICDRLNIWRRAEALIVALTVRLRLRRGPPAPLTGDRGLG